MAGAQILVVEDHFLNRRLVRDVLERRGHTVLEATTVHEGRAALEGKLPDLVLLDIGLPGGGGEVLLREIRASPRLASLPVIAVTAYAMVGDRERFLNSGFDGYLSKPIDIKTFGSEIERFLRSP